MARCGYLMKTVLILITILAILFLLVGIILQGRIIFIQLTIPEALLPYYEWMRAFPGLKPTLENPLRENQPHYKTYHA